MKSIRREITIRILGGAALLHLIASVTIGIAIVNLDTREFDAAMETKAKTIATLVIRDNDTLEVGFAGEYMPEFETPTNPEYFQFYLPDGTVIERSDMLGDLDLPFVSEATEQVTFRDLRLPDGRRGRLVQISFPPRSRGEREEGAAAVKGDGGRFRIPHGADPQSTVVVLSLARGRAELDRLLRSVWMALGGVSVLLVGLLGLIAHRSIGRGFAPLDTMNAQILSLGHPALDQRISLPHPPAELQNVLSALNGLLGSLEAVFTREQRFSSDVAHELRTLVAELRASCEVATKWQDDPELVKRRLESMLDSALNMERVVCNLLELARSDRGAATMVLSKVHVAQLLDTCWVPYAQEAEQRGLRPRNSIDPSLVVNTDRDKLEMIVQNLISNAVSHGVPETEIACTSSVDQGAMHICVENHARDIQQEDLPHLLERFWCKDSARTGGRHSGLGLPIVKSLADVLGIRLDVDVGADDVFKVSLSFPAEDIQ